MMFAINDMTLALKDHYIALDQALTTFIDHGKHFKLEGTEWHCRLVLTGPPKTLL